MRALAPCKINLGLEVLGQRADGYHELDTTLLALEPCDELRLERTASGRVELELSGEHAAPDVPRDGRNLAARAAEGVLRLGHARGLAPEVGLRLELCKNVPSGAGLGGGSSDAAAAAWAARETLACTVADAEIGALLAQLGSDTLFFWEARDTGFARARGRGERIEPQRSRPNCVFVLLTPDVACSTASVYAEHARVAAAEPARARSATEHACTRFNALEDAALRAVPELRAWRAWLDACAPGAFHLCGSGSSFYAAFATETAALAQRAALASDARRRGLRLRGLWMSHPTDFGARLLRP